MSKFDRLYWFRDTWKRTRENVEICFKLPRHRVVKKYQSYKGSRHNKSPIRVYVAKLLIFNFEINEMSLSTKTQLQTKFDRVHLLV